MEEQLLQIINDIKNETLEGGNSKERIALALSLLQNAKASFNYVQALATSGTIHIGSIKSDTIIPSIGSVWGFANSGTYANAGNSIVPEGKTAILSRNAEGVWNKTLLVTPEFNLSSLDKIIPESPARWEDLEKTNNKRINGFGNLQDFDEGNIQKSAVTDFYPVKAGTTLKIRGRASSAQTLLAVHQTTSSQAIEKFVGAGVFGNPQWAEATYTAAQDCFVRFSAVYYFDGENSTPQIYGLVLPIEKRKALVQTDVDAKVASLKTASFTGKTYFPKPLPTGGMLSIIDDDGHYESFNYLYPMLKGKGIPYALAICGNLMGSYLENRPIMSEANLLSMKDDVNYVEILNHSWGHINCANANYYEKWRQVEKNHKWLRDREIVVEGFVTPYGAYDSDLQEIISKFYDYHVSTAEGSNNLNNMQNYNIRRVRFGEGVSVDSIKQKIDAAIANNEWIVLMIHVNGYDHYANWRLDFENICDYIKSSGIATLKPTQAFRRMKNRMEVVNDFKIGADGKLRSY